MTDRVLFVDGGDGLAERATELLDVEGLKAEACSTGDDVDASGFHHVVTLSSKAKAGCPPLSPGTHYLHWPLEPGDDVDARLAQRIAEAFGGAKTYTPSDDLPEAWREAE